MNRLLAFAAAIEALTGLAMIAAPAIVAGLLIGVELSVPAIGVVRFGGVGLLALGIAAWPGAVAAFDARRSLQAMLTYNLLAALYLAYLGIRGEWTGMLLWPAAALHAVMTLLIVRAWVKARETVRA